MQVEFVPLILLELANLLVKDLTQKAIEFLHVLNISNEMFKEHLIELCSNK